MIHRLLTSNGHADLVSASIVPDALSAPVEEWTLKKVKGDAFDISKQGYPMKGLFKLLILMAVAILLGVTQANPIYVAIYGASVLWAFYSFSSKPGNLSRDIGKLNAAALSLLLAVSITGLGYAIGFLFLGNQ